jgi:hypothetical protein
MKRYLWMILALSTIATPAIAATTVYLKDGGKIKARSAWRANGRVNVLLNRDSITDFSPSEINMKRTFPPKRHVAQKQEAPGSARTAATTLPATAECPPQTGNTVKSLLNKLPSLPEKSPESLVPSGGAGGTIKQHKKGMSERANE